MIYFARLTSAMKKKVIIDQNMNMMRHIQIMLKIDDCKKVLNKGTLNDKMKEAIKKKENEALQLHLKNKKEHKYKATEFEYKKYKVGEIIEGKCCHWKKFYRGIVRQVNGDDTYYIKFDDGEERPTFSYIL